MLFLFHLVTCYLTVRWLILKARNEALEAVGGIVADLMKPSCFGFLGSRSRNAQRQLGLSGEIAHEDAGSAPR